MVFVQNNWMWPGPKVIKLFLCSTQLTYMLKYVLNIYVQMSTIVDILTFISMIDTTSDFESKKSLFFNSLNDNVSC